MVSSNARRTSHDDCYPNSWWSPTILTAIPLSFDPKIAYPAYEAILDTPSLVLPGMWPQMLLRVAEVSLIKHTHRCI